MEMEEETEKKREMNLLELPDGCLAHILSLTSPVHILWASLVCKLFRSLAQSDVVWEKFLPIDDDVILRHLSALNLSKKELVLHLCRDFVLIGDATMSFALDKWTAKKCYMLSARALTILRGNNPYCWSWKPLEPLPKSRFPEVAELLGLSYVQITASIETQLLSPNTTYHAYFSFKLRSWSVGFDVCPVKVVLTCMDRTGTCINDSSYHSCRTFYLKPPESNILDIVDDGEVEAFMYRRDEGDSWLKIDMGKYFNRADDNVAVLEMILIGMDASDSLKSGLVVHGIELLPLD